MTGDELERAIDFLLKSQAGAEARIERNDEQLSKLAEQVSQLREEGAGFQKRLDSIAIAHTSLEDSHANLVRAMTQYLETQDQINKSLRETDVRQDRFSASLGESLRASDESLRAAMAELAGRQTRTEESLARLAEQTAGTDRRLEALIKIVEEGRNGGR